MKPAVFRAFRAGSSVKLSKLGFTGSMTPVTTDVPEPASFTILSAGIFGIGFIHRYSRKTATRDQRLG